MTPDQRLETVRSARLAYERALALAAEIERNALNARNNAIRAALADRRLKRRDIAEAADLNRSRLYQISAEEECLCDNPT